MLIGDKIKLPSINISSDKIKATGNTGALILGILFSLTFCPTSGLFYFGMLIPMSATATAVPFSTVAMNLKSSNFRELKIFRSFRLRGKARSSVT